LSQPDCNTIKNEITEYRLKVSQTKAFQETYSAPWETVELWKKAITASNAQPMDKIEEHKITEERPKE
jgi:hypothetical protein